MEEGFGVYGRKCESLQGASQVRVHYAEEHPTALDVEVEAAPAKHRDAREN